MTERIQIVVEAIDRASGALKAITGQVSSVGSALKTLGGLAVAYGVFDKITDSIKDSISVTMEYAQEVRDLSLISGQSAEETSRMLQVMDDFQLSANDATTAVRTLTKAGLAPTIGTMADLADQYVKLNSAQAKNEFILKNLGRSGLQWANMLAKGGDAIREMGANVNQSLIFTEENLKAAEDYRLALDNWNDSVLALKISVGNALLPALTDLLDVTTNLGDAAAETQKREDYAKMSIFDRARATIEAANAMGDESRAADNVAQAVTDMGAAEGDAVDPAKALAEAQKELSRANQAILSNMFEIQSASEDFVKGEEDRAARLKEIEAEKLRVALEQRAYWNDEEIINRKLNKHHGDRVALQAQSAQNMEKLNSLTQKQLELEAEYNQVLQDGEQAVEDRNQAANKMIYSMLEQKLAQDGITDSADVEYLQNTAVSMGLIDKASADAAISAAKAADALYDGFTKGLPPLTVTKERLADIASYNGQTVSMTVFANIITNLSGATYDPFQNYGERRAMGGPVRAGESYWVGERGIPELYVPTQDGTIIPADKVNPTTIQIFATVRSDNDIDYIAQEVGRRLSR